MNEPLEKPGRHPRAMPGMLDQQKMGTVHDRRHPVEAAGIEPRVPRYFHESFYVRSRAFDFRQPGRCSADSPPAYSGTC